MMISLSIIFRYYNIIIDTILSISGTNASISGGLEHQRKTNHCMLLCTPGMGVNLWGGSPLYVNPVNMLNILTKVLAEDKGGIARDRLKEVRAQSYEPTNRNGI
jgi:hypothetical protein